MREVGKTIGSASANINNISSITSRASLSKEIPNSVVYHDDVFYTAGRRIFSNEEEPECIYKMKIDGAEKILLIEEKNENGANTAMAGILLNYYDGWVATTSALSLGGIFF